MYSLSSADYVTGFTSQSIIGTYNNFCDAILQKTNEQKKRNFLSKNKLNKSLIFPEEKILEQSKCIDLSPGRMRPNLTREEINLWLLTKKGDQTSRKTKEIVEFAKNIFKSWDTNGSGEVPINRVIEELIELGMSQDHRFVESLVQEMQKIGFNPKPGLILEAQFVEFFKWNKSVERAFLLLKEEAAKQKNSIRNSKVVLRNFEKLLRPYPNNKFANCNPINKHLRIRNKFSNSLDISNANNEIETVQKWWSEIEKSTKSYEKIPFNKISDYLISKGIVRNIQKVKKLFGVSLKPIQNLEVEYNDFKKIFYKGILQDAIKDAYKGVRHGFKNKSMPEFLRISGYKKSLLLKASQSNDYDMNISLQNTKILQALRKYRDKKIHAHINSSVQISDRTEL